MPENDAYENSYILANQYLIYARMDYDICHKLFPIKLKSLLLYQ